jgi:hypothetical protein
LMRQQKSFHSSLVYSTLRAAPALRAAPKSRV